MGLLLVSLLAGTATIPYIAYHFHRISPYGVVANLLAMPVVSAWVMPWGIFGVVTMPFGLDGFCWRLMGDGIDWMIAVAALGLEPSGRSRTHGGIRQRLAAAVQRWASWCFACSGPPLRFVGAFLIGCAVVMMIRSPQPDVLVAADGSAFAVRGTDGRLAMVRSGSDSFALREWLAADADARTPKDTTLAAGIRCDEAGCIGRLRDGSLVAIAKTVEAFEEDCRRAAVVVSARDAPAACGALVIDRRVWRRSGAIALRRVGERFEITPTRPDGYDRPWARAVASSARQRRPVNRRRRDRSRAMPRRGPRTWRRGIRSYRRNSPTILPWMRTRLGGRMRTS